MEEFIVICCDRVTLWSHSHRDIDMFCVLIDYISRYGYVLCANRLYVLCANRLLLKDNMAE